MIEAAPRGLGVSADRTLAFALSAFTRSRPVPGPWRGGGTRRARRPTHAAAQVRTSTACITQGFDHFIFV